MSKSSIELIDGRYVFTNHRIGNQLINSRPDGSVRVQTINEEPSLAQQQFKDQCDINHIMEKYSETGTITHLNPRTGVYADVSQFGDLRESFEKIQKADELFMQLPAKVRSKFENDPLKFVDWCSDPKNLDEAVSLGLAEKKPVNVTTSNDDANKGVAASSETKPSVS